MKKIISSCGNWEYVPTKEKEVSQNKVVYKCYFLGAFVGYRVKCRNKVLVKGVEKNKGFKFVPCEKVYEDIYGTLKFIVC